MSVLVRVWLILEFGNPLGNTADGEELPRDQELRHLASLRLSLRHAQYVPRVQGPYPDRCC